MYLIETKDGAWVYRVWGCTDAFPGPLETILEVQSQLAERGLPIVRPIPLPSGGYLQTLSAPEGDRPAALFSFAVGKPVGRGVTPKQSAAIGRLTADFHLTADTLSPFPELPVYDMDAMVLEPANVIRECGAISAAQKRQLADIVRSLSQQLGALEKTPPLFGICHGDVHGMNALFAGDEDNVSLLDFDRLSTGWRAWDLAVFVWWIRGVADEERVKRAFLEGYRAIHPHAEAVIRDIPIFVPIRHLLLTRDIIRNAERGLDVGRWIDDAFIGKRLGFIQDWMQKYELFI